MFGFYERTAGFLKAAPLMVVNCVVAKGGGAGWISHLSKKLVEDCRAWKQCIISSVEGGFRAFNKIVSV